MAKFLVTRSSYFEPFSYDELIKPVAIAQQAHEATQDAYNNMSVDTAMLENYISQNEDDKQARALYDNYKQKLQTLQDNLWANGINARTKRDLSAARTAYASDITRLAKAVENRQARSREYWEARHKNPDLVMGQDPGLSGLDNYLNNDRYGQDYFSYDSGKFEQAVASEWKTRAADMLRGLTDPNSIIKNPQLASQLTRVIQQGATNNEVAAAGTVVDQVVDMTDQERKQYYDVNKVDPIVQLLSESLINRYDSTGIRQGNVSASERARLLDRGKAGLAAGILGKGVKDFEDPEYAFNQQLRLYNAKRAIENPELSQSTINDSNSTIYDNSDNAKKAESRLNGYIGGGDNRVSYKGHKDVRLGAAASALVYSEDVRRDAYKELGFDVGRDPGLHDASKYLHGEFVGSDDNVYETMYMPKVKGLDGVMGAVLIRKKGETQWQKDARRTRIYNSARKQYLDNLEDIKKNRRDLYTGVRAFGMDPDRQYEVYQKEGIPQNTSILDFENLYNTNSKNKGTLDVKDYNIATRGTDKGDYIGKIADYIAGNIKVKGDKGDQTSKDRSLRTHDGQATHLHKIENGVIQKETIRNAGDVFKFKDGKITNIQSIDIDSDGLYNGYIKVRTDSGEWIAVGIDMIDSNRVKSIFAQSKNWITNNAPYAESTEAFEIELDKLVNRAAGLIKNAMWMNITQDKQSTNKEDNN